MISPPHLAIALTSTLVFASGATAAVPADRTVPTPPQPVAGAPASSPETAAQRPEAPATPPGEVVSVDPLAALTAPVVRPDERAAPVTTPEQTVPGVSVGAGTVHGTVAVRVPGTNTWTKLVAGASVPTGTVIDGRAGAVEIASEAAGGVEQRAVMGGAIFRVEQRAGQGGMTDIVLLGGNFAGCPAPGRARRRTAAPGARAAAVRRRSSGARRTLWASGRGRFRTRGRFAHASVRGTHWIVSDGCTSTTVRVVEGVVDVAATRGGTRVAVRAGQRVVVPARGARR